MKLLKVLDKNLTSPYQNFKFKVGKKYICKDFDNNKTVDCSRGFYATDWNGLSYAYRQNRSVFECEVGGKSVEVNQFKRRYETIEIIRELSLDEIKQGLIDATPTAGYDLYHASFPVDPLKIRAELTQVDKDNLIKWSLVGASVMDSVGDSVWVSVMASVWSSVRDSVMAYVSSLFPGIPKWHYIGLEPAVNPYKSAIDLWHRGFVPSYDGKTWRLHSGPSAKIVFELPQVEVTDGN
jgi:hypothetical protein